jgi:putative hemolysin
VRQEFETVPTKRFACPTEHIGRESQQPARLESAALQTQLSIPTKVPKLLKTYFASGARIAAPPAWDREFGTIDFLTLLDLKTLSPAARNRFLAPLTQ